MNQSRGDPKTASTSPKRLQNSNTFNNTVQGSKGFFGASQSRQTASRVQHDRSLTGIDDSLIGATANISMIQRLNEKSCNDISMFERAESPKP